MIGSSIELKRTIELLIPQPFTTDCYMISMKWWKELMSTLDMNLDFKNPINNLDLV